MFYNYELSDLDLDEENFFGRINCLFLKFVGDFFDGFFRELDFKEKESFVGLVKVVFLGRLRLNDKGM